MNMGSNSIELIANPQQPTPWRSATCQVMEAYFVIFDRKVHQRSHLSHQSSSKFVFLEPTLAKVRISDTTCFKVCSWVFGIPQFVKVCQTVCDISSTCVKKCAQPVFLRYKQTCLLAPQEDMSLLNKSPLAPQDNASSCGAGERVILRRRKTSFLLEQEACLHVEQEDKSARGKRRCSALFHTKTSRPVEQEDMCLFLQGGRSSCSARRHRFLFHKKTGLADDDMSSCGNKKTRLLVERVPGTMYLVGHDQTFAETSRLARRRMPPWFHGYICNESITNPQHPLTGVPV